MVQKATEPQADSIAPKVAVSGERALRANDDLLQSPEVQAALAQLQSLAGEANEAERLADDHATENSEAARDAMRAREAADIAISGQTAIKVAARSGDKSMVATVAQRSLVNARIAVGNASDAIEDHEHATTGSSSERTAHGADIKKAAEKKKAAAAKPAKKPMDDEHDGKKKAALRGVVAHADGDDGGIVMTKKAKAKPNYGVRIDKDDSVEEREEKKAKRKKRSQQNLGA